MSTAQRCQKTITFGICNITPMSIHNLALKDAYRNTCNEILSQEEKVAVKETAAQLCFFTHTNWYSHFWFHTLFLHSHTLFRFISHKKSSTSTQYTFLNSCWIFFFATTTFSFSASLKKPEMTTRPHTEIEKKLMCSVHVAFYQKENPNALQQSIYLNGNVWCEHLKNVMNKKEVYYVRISLF